MDFFIHCLINSNLTHLSFIIKTLAAVLGNAEVLAILHSTSCYSHVHGMCVCMGILEESLYNINLYTLTHTGTSEA